MKQAQIETRTQEIGQEIFGSKGRGFKGILSQSFWQERVMQWSTSNPRVKTQLFRFVDVLPVLKTQEDRRQHLIEYLTRPANQDSWPWLLSFVSFLLKTPLHPIVTKVADQQVRQMGNTFIIGQNAHEALPRVEALRRNKAAFTLDVLGEAVVSDVEVAHYTQQYDDLIDDLARLSKNWSKVDSIDQTPLGEIPSVNLSVKVSAFDSMTDSLAYESSIERICSRLEPLLEKAMLHRQFINFDMEQFALNDLTKEVFKRLMMKPQFQNYRHFGIVIQTYLRRAHDDALEWIDFAKQRGCPITIRLVKGAYWDYEVIAARQNGWEPPVFLEKWQSDVQFEKCAFALLQAYPHIELALGSHNVRSISYAIAVAEAFELPLNAFEVQMLFGMSGAFKSFFINKGMRFREYCPVGEMIPGLSYLVRRLLENTANDSFLKQSFLDHKAVGRLLKAPAKESGKGNL